MLQSLENYKVRPRQYKMRDRISISSYERLSAREVIEMQWFHSAVNDASICIIELFSFIVLLIGVARLVKNDVAKLRGPPKKRSSRH
jgi:hypothetical protein